MDRYPAATLKYSNSGANTTKAFESCRLAAYIPAPGDVPTIGWGHTKDVKLGMVCTQAQADAWFLEDIAGSVTNVQRCVQTPITQQEFDAFVDFDYNCGDLAFSDSTLLRKFNAGDLHGAADEFGRWTHVAGEVLAGLVRRRAAELAEFND